METETEQLIGQQFIQTASGIVKLERDVEYDDNIIYRYIHTSFKNTQHLFIWMLYSNWWYNFRSEDSGNEYESCSPSEEDNNQGADWKNIIQYSDKENFVEEK